MPAGRVVIDPDVHANRHGLADELLKRLTSDERHWVEHAVRNFSQLTPREKEIAQRLTASHNTEGIASALTVSVKTTENYITHVYDKLGLSEWLKRHRTCTLPMSTFCIYGASMIL